MKLKKFICGLLTLNMILGSGASVSAVPMKKILEEMDEMGYFEKDEALNRIRERTLRFLQEERKKKLSFYDHASERSDSLAFAFFCYLCICGGANASPYHEAALNKACGGRSATEHLEDMAVINDILPQNTVEFAERFGVSLDERKRLELSDFVTRYTNRSVSPDLSPVGRYTRASENRRRERKPDRRIRETMLEGKELAEDGYGCGYGD